MKFVYSFEEGNKDMKEILGGKGANLAEMTKLGLPVPGGFIVTTEACNTYYQEGQKINDSIVQQILDKIKELEEKTGKGFGNPANPLLVSVRSGARASMPGMMDTILNLGLNDIVAQTFSNRIGNPRFVYDSYRRFIAMFADVVKGYPRSAFENVLTRLKTEKNLRDDTQLTAEDMLNITREFKKIYYDFEKEEFPQDPKVQLIESIKAVFRSWNNERAIIYRRMNDIPSSWGTAVNVQQMVYGNRGMNSGTGVAFTRNPATGENELYGEYLINAQGEDVVAGVRTPKPISTLKEDMPTIYDSFLQIAKSLENHYQDMQDMEFTIEDGKLYILQTRNGKRTASAALKIAVDLVKEGKISKQEALLKVEPKQLDQLLHKNFVQENLKKSEIIAKGLAASPGAACGKIYFTAEDVSNAKKRGEETILVRLETSPEDIQGMQDASGILTVRGGMTSHAAVVARGMGRCCVSGCEEISIQEKEKVLKTKDGKIYKEGDYLSLDGSTGFVYGEKIAMTEPEISGDFEVFMNWADEVRRLKIRANADNERDALQAKKFGAEGIGLCRTEHMFFDEKRIFSFRKMILAENSTQRENALSEILPYQKEDFINLFRAMEGSPVVIRYLDPPLHEFLPHTKEEIAALAESLEISIEDLKERISSLKEFNPMMGHRGCRLDVTYPEIARMQTRAVIEAAIEVSKQNIRIEPEIMIPLIGELKELQYVKKIVCETADDIIKKSGVSIVYHVGTMIEIPRAALLADEIAKDAEFFSFGTNDLTQLTYGFSRDDAGKFLKDYYDKQIFEFDPFAKIDQAGVGMLMKIAVSKGRLTRSDLHLGICGEHAGEVSSVAFCDAIGLDYVSCSPFRVPASRLAAAQASIREKANK